MKKKLIILSLFITILLPIELMAWGQTGHRVIAEIAQKNVNCKTRRKINKLLDGYPMANWANWADYIRSDTTGRWQQTFIWHYANIQPDLSKPAFLDAIKAIKQNNVYSEIPKLQEILKNKKSSDDDKRVALYFLIHLVGDIHQPMHVGREEDLGGNKISVFWFNAPDNIHSVWDSKLIDFEKYSYTEYTKILNNIKKSKKKQLQEGTLEDWFFETYTLTNEIYSSVKDGDKLSYKYTYKYKTIVETQLQKAGLRLAFILNKAF